MKIYRDKEGNCINIGDWDDKEGINPIPDGAYEDDAEVIKGWDDGLYLADNPKAIKS